MKLKQGIFLKRKRESLILQKMKNEDLLREKILWEKHPSNENYFYIEDKNAIVLLRINNFPDEPLLTLINGLDILDLEDKPDEWTIKY